jgi:ATP-binding cassette subfamily C protein
MPRVTSLNEKVQAIAGELPALGAVDELTRQCAAAAEPPAADVAAPDLTREIRLEGVSFTYEDDRALPAVEGLDLTIPSGRTTAIVGPSGSGKSTTVDLLLGLLTPQEGRILVDGTPLTPALIGAWRRQVGYVPQETLLFHATIRENLLWVRPDATDEEMSEALRLAAADGFVANLPRGLETVVGDRGVLLSGGERQRLSLARALLRRPRLLVLDEATSSLDSENEMRIQKAIDGLHTQVTMVIVAHRLSTIRSADFIYVLDHGRAVERGTWKELTSRRTGRFLDLYRAQGWQP